MWPSYRLELLLITLVLCTIFVLLPWAIVEVSYTTYYAPPASSSFSFQFWRTDCQDGLIASSGNQAMGRVLNVLKAVGVLLFAAQVVAWAVLLRIHGADILRGMGLPVVILVVILIGGFLLLVFPEDPPLDGGHPLCLFAKEVIPLRLRVFWPSLLTISVSLGLTIAGTAIRPQRSRQDAGSSACGT